ncbi:MAG: NupC/NupG family nucleoside CNT transporter [Planctomycetaceae bacterium]|nr:NupC/NupG family nucleoside CNT transporter [Planctomycetaceae bacterium]
MERVISFFGLFAMIGLAWLISSDRKRLNWRIIGGGLLLQIVFALLILKTPFGRSAFGKFDDFFRTLMSFVGSGSEFMFNVYPREGEDGLPAPFTLLRTFAFGVLPTIVFFSALMSVLYYIGIMQQIIRLLAIVMQKSLGTSGAESLSAAANIFVGQTEAPLVVRPYVLGMTKSELMAVMVGGFSTIAGGVMAAYVGMGINAGHLLTASVISAPAALLIAKVMQPEVDQPETLGFVQTSTEKPGSNIVEAAAIGASDGMKLALNVCAMLIAFLALLAMCNAIIGWFGNFFGQEWSIQVLLGYVFWPIAWLMGIETQDCMKCGELLGVKLVLTEFVAYDQLANASAAGAENQLSERTTVIMTYALSGFANFGSIGIQIGGIGGIAPERRGDLAALGMRAMFGGMLACCMTACIAGVLL